MSITAASFHCNSDLKRNRIMSSSNEPITNCALPQIVFWEELSFTSKKYKEYMNILKDYDLHYTSKCELNTDCPDGSERDLCESVCEMSPLLIRTIIRVFKYMEKLGNERIQSNMVLDILQAQSSDLFDSETFPRFELDLKSNITLRRVGNDLRVIKCYFDCVKGVESSNDGDEEYHNLLEEIVDSVEKMQVHHKIICSLLDLEMDYSVVSIQEELIQAEVRFERFSNHYQLACVASKYLTSFYNEIKNVYNKNVCD